MALQAFVSRRSDGAPWPPDHEYETGATCGIIQRLWAAFHHERVLYAALVNLHRPSADLVLVNDRGIGIVEMKHSAGVITSRDGVWYAGEQPIKAGTRSDIKNPREQVQAYAKTIRSIIAEALEPVWKVPQADIFRQINVQTAVCFTNRDADIAATRVDLEREAQTIRRPWEVFSILTPAEIPEWALRLSFGMKQGREADFAPYTLNGVQIYTLATRTFQVTEWSEIRELMPDGQPYGYLLLMHEGRGTRYFPLKELETTIGRDSTKCDLPIPETYSKASRIQARITRVAGYNFIEDLGSSRGTFVNGLRLDKPIRLIAGQTITFGGTEPGTGICELRFTTKLPDDLAADSTMMITTVPGISVGSLRNRVITSLHQSESVDFQNGELWELLLTALENMFSTSKNWIICSIDNRPILDEAEFRDVIWGRDHYASLSITQSGMKYLRSGLNRQGVTRSTGEVGEESTAEAGVFEFRDMENLIQTIPTPRRAKDLAEERRAIARAINNRRGQAKFRQDLIDAYGQCLVTGCTYKPILEAAHIHPYSEGGDFSVENGLLLRADIHTLFDLGLIAICTLNDRYRVIMSELLYETEYIEYNGDSLHIDADSSYRPDQNALEEHLVRSGLEYLCY